VNTVEIDRFARVANIEKTMELLEALSVTKDGATVSELSRQLGVPASGVSRLLSTLGSGGYVFKDPVSGQYRLALKFLALGARYTDQLGFDELFGPLLRDGAEKCAELVQLALIEGDEMRYVARADVNNRIRVVSLLGQRVAPHAFAAGKIWLADLPVERALKVALEHGLTKLTPNTITQISALQVEIDTVRTNGFATNLEEVDAGLIAISVPVRTPKNSLLVGALTMSAPMFRVSPDRLREHLPVLNTIANQIGESLSMSAVIELLRSR
jgi:DNA-binding IclR family transcriptional regulator